MKPLQLTTPTPTSIRILRSFDVPRELVWRAHTEPELLKRWMTGPPGHSLPVCEIDFRVGGAGRYVWKSPEFEMELKAEFLEIVEHERIVHTEAFDFWPEGASTVTTTLAESGDVTTITLNIEYATQGARDDANQPAFAEGYEASYAQLDEFVKELATDS